MQRVPPIFLGHCAIIYDWWTHHQGSLLWCESSLLLWFHGIIQCVRTPRSVCEKMFRSQQFAFGVGRWLLNNRLKVQLIFLCKYLRPGHELLCIRCRVCAEIIPNLGTRLLLCQWWRRSDIFPIPCEILGAESSGNTAASMQDKCFVPLFRNALEVDDDGNRCAWSYHRRR